MYLLTRSMYVVVAAVIFLTTSTNAFAEEATPKGISISIFHVAPGKEQAFEHVSTKFKAAADKVKSPAYIGYSPGIGNDGMYAFASNFSSFSVYADSAGPMAEVYNEKELAEIGAMFQDSVSSTESYVIVPRPDLSVVPPTFKEPPEVLMLIEVTIKNGSGPAYVEFLQQLKVASEATAPDVYWTAFQPGFGSGPVWRFGIPMNWADLDTQGPSVPERLMNHFGKRKGEQIFLKSLESVESVNYTISRIRPDISHQN